jgi:hypothetical protein
MGRTGSRSVRRPTTPSGSHGGRAVAGLRWSLIHARMSAVSRKLDQCSRGRRWVGNLGIARDVAGDRPRPIALPAWAHSLVWLEHPADNREVVGSNPTGPISARGALPLTRTCNPLTIPARSVTSTRYPNPVINRDVLGRVPGWCLGLTGAQSARVGASLFYRHTLGRVVLSTELTCKKCGTVWAFEFDPDETPWQCDRRPTVHWCMARCPKGHPFYYARKTRDNLGAGLVTALDGR